MLVESGKIDPLPKGSRQGPVLRYEGQVDGNRSDLEYVHFTTNDKQTWSGMCTSPSNGLVGHDFPRHVWS